MRLGLFVSVVAVMSAAPASGCYTGPLGVGFIGRTAKLSDWGEANLGGYALDRRDYPGTRVLVIFYGNGINSAKDRVLLLERQNAVRAYLLGQRVPQSDFTIAVTRKAPSALVVSYSGGTPPAATVELTSGCGR